MEKTIVKQKVESLEQLCDLCCPQSCGLTGAAILRDLNRIGVTDISKLMYIDENYLRKQRGIGTVRLLIIMNMQKTVVSGKDIYNNTEKKVLDPRIEKIANAMPIYSGSYLRRARRLLGFRMQDMADLMHTTVETIGNIEREKRGTSTNYNRQYYSMILCLLFKEFKHDVSEEPDNNYCVNMLKI